MQRTPAEISDIAEREILRRLEAYDRLQDVNTELLAALEAARGELQEVTMELHGEDYNNPTMNAIIAKAKP